jgi:hypothetical protein
MELAVSGAEWRGAAVPRPRSSQGAGREARARGGAAGAASAARGGATMVRERPAGGNTDNEFFAPRKVDLLQDLRAKFDPTGRGAQENPAMYSDKALLRRESLKYDPRIIRTLSELWDMIDSNGNGRMDQTEYREFHGKLATVLIPSIPRARLDVLFEADWVRDTDGGNKEIARSTFGDAMFELADRWTDDISAADYISFLQGTFQALSIVDPATGKRVYKSDADLRAAVLACSPLSRLHGQSLQEARARAAAEERVRARAFRDGVDFDAAAFDKDWDRQVALGLFAAGGACGASSGSIGGSQAHAQAQAQARADDESPIGRRGTWSTMLRSGSNRSLSNSSTASEEGGEAGDKGRRRKTAVRGPKQPVATFAPARKCEESCGLEAKKGAATNSAAALAAPEAAREEAARLMRRPSTTSCSSSSSNSSSRSSNSSSSSSSSSSRSCSTSSSNSNINSSSNNDINAASAAAATAAAAALYPPSREWWDRHARARPIEQRIPTCAAVSSRVVLGPAWLDKVGVVLFDPLRPDHLVRLIISVNKVAVVASDRLPLMGTLAPLSGDVLELPLTAGVRQGGAAIHETADLRGFCHGLSRGDWKLFCAAVDELVQSGRGLSPAEIAFVGFSSTYDAEARAVGSQLHFSSADVAAKLSNVIKRAKTGLTCPLLQGKIAKYVVHSLRVSQFKNSSAASDAHVLALARADAQAASPGDALTFAYPNMLRTLSAQLLFACLLPDKQDSPTRTPQPPKRTLARENYNQFQHQQLRLATTQPGFMEGLHGRLEAAAQPSGADLDRVLDARVRYATKEAERTLSWFKKHALEALGANDVRASGDGQGRTATPSSRRR